MTPESDQRLQAEFLRLRDQWKNETAVSGSATRIVENPNYQAIIKMGISVLPLIFEDLEAGADHWSYALCAITGQNPINSGDEGNLIKIRESWLDWWEKNKNFYSG